MPPFAFKDGDDFFGHRVTHKVEDRPGKLPRQRNTIHCNFCNEEEIYGDTPSEIRQAFINARQDHHIRVMAARLSDLEQADRHHEGGELLGG